MRRLAGLRPHDVVNNTLIVVRQYDAPDGSRRIIFQGKRVSKDHPMSHEERRAYVTQSFSAAVGVVRRLRGVSIKEAIDIVRQGETWPSPPR